MLLFSRALAFGLVLLLAAPVAAQDAPITTRLLSDADPGTGDGAAFERFFDATLNEAGDLVFAAALDGPGVTSSNDRGLWLLTRTGTLTLLGREGDPAPGGPPGAVFRDFSTPVPINAAGTVAFRARRTGPSVDFGNDEVIYLGTTAGIAPVLVEGNAAPGFPGLTISDPRNITGALDRPALNDAGELAFRAQLFDPAINNLTDGVLYAGPPAALVALLQTSEPVSGTGIAGATLFNFGNVPELLDGGTVATSARVDGAGGRTDLLGFVEGKDDLDPVARQGDPAPGGGTFGGGTFGTFDGFTTNQQRDVAFRTFVNTGGGSERRIVAGQPGALQEVATTGDPAPGVPDKTYASVANLRLGYDGEVAYASFLVPTGVLDNQAVFATADGVPTLVAREGDPAPGGNVYREPDDPVIGDGVVAFPTGNPPFELERIYAWTPEGGVRLVVGGGITVAPGDLRGVDDLDLATTGSGFEGGEEAGGPGEGRTINHRNVLAFTVEFSDGTAGVFTAALGGGAGRGLDLMAEATSPLTVAPGGQISFSYSVTNPTDAPVTGDLYFVAEQGGAVVAQGRVRSGTVPAGQTGRGTFVQQVPAGAPAGDYDYALRIGSFPDGAADEELFTLTVTNTPVAAAAASVWTVAGATAWAEEPAASDAGILAHAVAEQVTAFPNPFTATATIRFALPEASEVRLAVYDALGREVTVLVDGALEAGAHAAAFDGRALPSGAYTWRLEAGGAVERGRLVLVR